MTRVHRAMLHGLAAFIASAPMWLHAGPGAGRPPVDVDYAGMSTEDIFLRSWTTPSEAERTHIRAWLAEKEPDSAAGLLSSAYLSSTQSFDRAEAVGKLERCVDRYAGNLYCRNNLAAYLKDPAKSIEQRKRILSDDDSFLDYEVYVAQYEEHLVAMKDEAGARKVMDEIKVRHPGHPFISWMQAVQRANAGEYKSAEELLEKAVDGGSLDFNLHRYLARIRFDFLGEREPGKRDDAIAGMLWYAEQLQKREPKRLADMERAYAWAADRLIDQKSYEQALIYYIQAFKAYPAAELAESVRTKVMGNVASGTLGFRAALKFLGECDRQMRGNSAVELTMARMLADAAALGDAEQYFRAAMEHADTPSQAADAARYYAHAVLEDGRADFEAARRLLAQQLALVSANGAARAELMKAAYINRLAAGDFHGALNALDRYEHFYRTYSTVNEPVFAERRVQLQTYLAGELDSTGRLEQLKLVRQAAKSAAPAIGDGFLALSPDGKTLAVGTAPVQLWDATKRTKLRDLGRGSFYVFSPKGDYIAIASRWPGQLGFDADELTVYEVATGNVKARNVIVEGGTFGLRDIAWDPSGKPRLVYVTSSGGPVIYDVQDGKRDKVALMPGNFVINAVAWTRTGKIVTGRATLDTLEVWNADTLEFERNLEGVSWTHTLATTADGKYLMALDNTRQLTVWDTATWKSRAASVRAWGTHAVVVPASGHTVILLETADSKEARVSRFDLDAMEPMMPVAIRGDVRGAGWSIPRGEIYVPSRESIEVLEPPKLKASASWTAAGVFGAQADLAHGYFITYDIAGIHVWDAATGAKKRDFPQVVEAMYRAQGTESLFVARARGDGGVGSRIVLLDTALLSVKTLYDGHGAISDHAANGKLVAIAYTESDTDRRKLGDGTEVTIGILRIADGKEAATLQVPVVTEETQMPFVTQANVEDISISSDGSRVALLTSWTDGYSTGTVRAKKVRIYSVATGRLVDNVEGYGEPSVAHFDDKDPNLIRIVDNNGGHVYDLAQRKELRRDDGRTGVSEIRLEQGRSVLWGRSFIRLREASGDGTFIPRPGDLMKVAVFEREKRMAVLKTTGEVAFYEVGP